MATSRIPTLGADGKLPVRFLPETVVTEAELTTALAALPAPTAGMTATPDPDDAEVLILTTPDPEV